jgi:integrase
MSAVTVPVDPAPADFADALRAFRQVLDHLPAGAGVVPSLQETIPIPRRPSSRQQLPLARLTLEAFFWRVYYPNYEARLGGTVKPRTVEDVLTTLRHWQRLTNDPPLAEIDGNDELLAAFVTALQREGLKPLTVKKHVRWVRTILGLASSGHRHYGAKRIVASVPHVVSPKLERRRPRRIPADLLPRLWQAAGDATKPYFEGVEPADYWRGLLMMSANTGVRTSNLRFLERRQVDVDAGRIHLLPSQTKGNVEQRLPLWPETVEAVSTLTHKHPLLFHWPARFDPWEEITQGAFYRAWRAIQHAAGVPVGETQFQGFQGIRRRVLSEVLRYGGRDAAQLYGGHASFDTTLGHYIDDADDIIEEAFAARPKPALETGGERSEI